MRPNFLRQYVKMRVSDDCITDRSVRQDYDPGVKSSGVKCAFADDTGISGMRCSAGYKKITGVYIGVF